MTPTDSIPIVEDRIPDGELLRRYAAGGEGAQPAFAELVKRHLDFVYSVAVRQVRDRHLAEDVTQAVFLVLAKKAARLADRTILSNWLFCTTRYTAANALKREVRRRHHEHKHQAMTPPNPTTDAKSDDADAAFDWDAVAPLLDNALDALGRRDREAVLLKYIEGRSHRDVAHAMGISEEAARKRVSRAIDRLRGAFAAGGVTLSVAAVTAVLVNNAAGAAPAGLAGAITAGVGGASGGAAAASLSKVTMSALSWTKAKIAFGLIALGATGAATGAAVKWHWIGGGNQQIVQAQANPAPRPQPPVVQAPAAAAQATQIEGVIRTPEETPAVGAEVFVVAKEDANTRQARLQWQAAMMTRRGARGLPQPKGADTVAVYDDQWPAGTVTCDGQGRFSFPAPPAGLPWILVARHPSGFAQITHDQFAALKGQVDLQSWGQVEGRVLVGDKPQPKVKVILYRSGSQDEWDMMQVRHNLETRTDAQGRFSFRDVAPGLAWLSKVTDEPRFKFERHLLVDVKPGVAMTVNVGGTGRPVVGRVATTPENEPNRKLEWVARGGISVDGAYHRSDRPNMPMKAGWERMSMAERIRTQREWELTTPEGRLSLERQWSERFEVRPDGSFRIDDLLPGKYQVTVRMLTTENHFGMDLVNAWMDFEVPPLPAGQTRSDEPLDVGTIKVTTIPRLQIGKPAPDFTVTGLDDGKPVKLSDFKGKTVVLKWFWNWNEMETEAPVLNRAYEKLIKDDPNLVLLTIGFDQEIETTRKRVADWHLGGVHTFAGSKGQQALPQDYFGSPSTLCIIGPDGKVLAKNLNTLDAEQEVAKVKLER